MDPLTLAILGGMALIGGIAKVVDISSGDKKNNDIYEAGVEADKAKAELEAAELEQQKAEQQRIYEQNKSNIESEFTAAQKEAIENAGRADAATTKNEGYLSSEYNEILAQMGLSQTQQAQQIQSASIGNSMNAGSDRAAVATNGTVNSSVQGAVERSAAYADKQLNSNVNAMNAANNWSLSGYQRNLSQNMDSINESRYQAQHLRDSYSEGGFNYLQYQNNLKQLALGNEISQARYQRNIDNLDTTGKKITINGKEYENAFSISSAYNKKIHDIQSPTFWDYGLGFISGGIGGANAGLNIASSYRSYKDMWG